MWLKGVGKSNIRVARLAGECERLVCQRKVVHELTLLGVCVILQEKDFTGRLLLFPFPFVYEVRSGEGLAATSFVPVIKVVQNPK